MPACSATNLPRVDDVLATLQVSSHKCKVMYYTEVLGSEDFRFVNVWVIDRQKHNFVSILYTCSLYVSIFLQFFRCLTMVYSFDFKLFLSFMFSHFSLLSSLRFPSLQPTTYLICHVPIMTFMNCLTSIRIFLAQSYKMRILLSLGNSVNLFLSNPLLFFVPHNPIFVLLLPLLFLLLVLLLLCLLPMKNRLLWCAEFVSGSVFAPFPEALDPHPHCRCCWLLIWILLSESQDSNAAKRCLIASVFAQN